MGASSFYYVIAHQSANEFEVGTGTVSGSTLTRTSVQISSNANAAVSFSAGTKDVFCATPALNLRPLTTTQTANQVFAGPTSGSAALAAFRALVAADLPAPSNAACNGRLTLTSGTPVTTADVASSTNVYWTPFGGNSVALWNSTTSAWQIDTFTEITLALGTMTSGAGYDIFAFDNAGAVNLEKLIWTNTTTRATDVTLQDGVYCKSGDKTRRYLGSFAANTTTAVCDFAGTDGSGNGGRRLLWNLYNQTPRPMFVTDTTGNWSYSTNTWRQARANTGNQVMCFIGLSLRAVQISAFGIMSGNGASNATVGVGIGSTAVNSAQTFGGGVNDSGGAGMFATYTGFPGIGTQIFAWLELAPAGSTTTWNGKSGQTVNTLQSGLQAMIWG